MPQHKIFKYQDNLRHKIATSETFCAIRDHTRLQALQR